MHAELLGKPEWTDATPRRRKIKPGIYVNSRGTRVRVYETDSNDQVQYTVKGAWHEISRPLALLLFTPAADIETDDQWMERQPTGTVAGLCGLALVLFAVAAVIGLIALAVL